MYGSSVIRSQRPRLLTVYLPVNVNTSSGSRCCIQGPDPLMCLLVILWLSRSLLGSAAAGTHPAHSRLLLQL